MNKIKYLLVLCFWFVLPLHAATSPVADEDAFLLDTLWSRYRVSVPKDNIKVGLALGGGGARGLAHIGVLKALEEGDVPVGAIAGTSVGALIGSLYAAGITTSQLERMTQEIGWSSLTNMSRYSLLRLVMTEERLSNKNMEIYLRKQIGDTRFDQLKIPFACAATDLQTGERVVFREGSVALAARASATIPGMFEPVVFRQRYLVDGGLVNNIPTDLVKLLGADVIVAVDVTADIANAQPKSVLSILNQAIYIQSERLAQDELTRAQVVIRPRMGDIGPMDLARSDESINAGIIAGRRAVPEIKRLILDKRFEQLHREQGAVMRDGTEQKKMESGRPNIKRSLFGLLLFCFLSLPALIPLHALAESMEDQKIAGLLSEIDKSSEKGDFSTVQTLRMRLADYAAQVPRYDVAVRQYELLLAARPGKADRVRYYKRLGTTRMAMQDYGRAISAFDDALHDSPKDWEANLNRARAFAAAEIYQRAIESYERCIHLRPGEGAPYEELARVYEKQGSQEKALTYYQNALAREPKPEIYLSMADCYVHLKNITQAIEILSQAKTRLPRADYDVRLGDIYQSLGDLPRAGAAWEEALKADAHRDDVRLKLTLIYDSLHRRADTDRILKELLSSYPRSPVVHYFKALVLYERGERSASREEALVVQDLAPTEGVSHFNELLLQQLRKPS